MTNDKRQTTINPWPPQTLQRRKQRLGDGKIIMTAPIESGGNNKAVRRVGNCITARAHWKRRRCSIFSNNVTVQQLWKQRGSSVALATASWWLRQQHGSGFGSSIVAQQLWQQHGSVAATTTAWRVQWLW